MAGRDFVMASPAEAVEGRESKVEKGDTTKMCATTCTEFGGKNLKDLKLVKARS